MKNKSPPNSEKLKFAWDLLCNPGKSPFSTEREACLNLLNEALKNGRKEPLNDYLGMMTNDCLLDLLWLADQNPALMGYCCTEPSVQVVWENYLNKILRCNQCSDTVNTDARQPLFLTVMGQCIAFQSSDHVYLEGLLKGLLNDEGIALLQLSLHYQSIYGAEYLLYHLSGLNSPLQIAEQFEFFHPLVDVHGTPGARACALAYWLYTIKLGTDSQSPEGIDLLEIALKETLKIVKVAELLKPYCKADSANIEFLNQDYWPLDGTDFVQTQTLLSTSYPSRLSDELLLEAQSAAMTISQQWIRTHSQKLANDFDEPNVSAFKI